MDCVWPSRQHVHLGTTKDSPRSAEAVDSGTKVNTVSAASTLEDHARSQLFQYMREVFIPSLMSSSNAQQSSQELITDSLELAEQVEFFLQALLACSALEIKSDDAIYRELAREYYTQAVSGLRTHLEGDDWKHVEFVALRTINLLCIYEVRYLSRANAQPLFESPPLTTSCSATTKRYPMGRPHIYEALPF